GDAARSAEQPALVMSRAGPLIALWLAVIGGWLLWRLDGSIELADDAANEQIEGQRVVRLADAMLERAPFSTAPDGVASASAIELPLHWDVQYEGASGRATVRVPIPTTPGSDPVTQGLLIERIGTAYQIELNGHVLAKAGSLEARDRFYAKA